MMKRVRFGVLVVIVMGLLFPRPVQADRLSMPHLAYQAPVPSEVQASLEAPFGDRPAQLGSYMPNAWNRTAASLLAPTFAAACADVVRHWGPEFLGTDRLRFRFLGSGSQARYFAIRCDSSVNASADYGDERLAILWSRGSQLSLKLIPHRSDCDHCSELSSLALLDKLPVPGADAIGIRFTTSSDNPCCGLPDRLAEEAVSYFLIKPDGPYVVLNLIIKREETDHTNPEGENRSILTASIRREHDPTGRVIRLVQDTRLEQSHRPPKLIRETYVWSATERRFLR